MTHGLERKDELSYYDTSSRESYLINANRDKKLKVVTEMERMSWNLPVAIMVE